MPEYKINPGIIRESLNELKIIQSWIKNIGINPENPQIILIGGWAVDAYNSWYGSVDIDIITTSDIRNDLKYYLRKKHGYLESRRELQMPSGIEKNTDYGKIIIDFIPKGLNQPFEGQDIPFHFSITEGNVTLKSIRNTCSMYIPTRTILIFLKLKAAWDRNFRVENNSSNDPDWDRSKLIKDYADILALLDPKSGGYETNLDKLGDLFDKYPFLLQTLFKIQYSREALERYGRLEKPEIKHIFDHLDNYFR